jgi:hypothetical protein
LYLGIQRKKFPQQQKGYVNVKKTNKDYCILPYSLPFFTFIKIMSGTSNNNNSNLPNSNNNNIDNINSNVFGSLGVASLSMQRSSNSLFRNSNFADVTIDVVGVDSELNGRSCSLHPCCGHTILIGDKLVCSWGVAAAPKQWQLKTALKKVPEEELEEHVKVYKIGTDGLASCHVGYLPRRLFKSNPAPSFDLMYLRVKLDYRISNNQHERSRSSRFLGIVLCEVIRNNPKYNGHNPFDNDPCDVSITSNPNNQIQRYSGRRLVARKSVILPNSPSNMSIASDEMSMSIKTPNRISKQKRNAASPSVANTSPEDAPKK